MGPAIPDAGVLIGVLDADDRHHERARQALRDAYERGDRLVLRPRPSPRSSSARRGAVTRRSGPSVRSSKRIPIEVAPLDEAIAISAAHIRATHPSVKLPDALVIANAIVRDARLLLTTDHRWPAGRSLGLRALVVAL